MGEMAEERDKEEIEKVRSDEMALRPKASRNAAERRRVEMEIARCVSRAIKTRDERSLAKQLRQAGFSEGSDVWNKVWEIYRASLRPK
jgi:NTP pyrophosphatase (non-canonical NTP hydrolase)